MIGTRDCLFNFTPTSRNGQTTPLRDQRRWSGNVQSDEADRPAREIQSAIPKVSPPRSRDLSGLAPHIIIVIVPR